MVLRCIAAFELTGLGLSWPLQFTQRVISRWNSMSQEDVDATSVNAFKGRLERRRRHQMDFF